MENLPSNAEDTGLIPCGRSWIPHTAGLRTLQLRLDAAKLKNIYIKKKNNFALNLHSIVLIKSPRNEAET